MRSLPLWFAAVLVTSCGGKIDTTPDLHADETATGGAPKFPGAGTSGADQPIPGAKMSCYYDASGTDPVATIEYLLETLTEGDAIHARVTFSPALVDNTYGSTAIGWRKHDLKALTKSDHLELTFSDAGARAVSRFKMDYVSESVTAASGFATLGLGGDGMLVLGDARDLMRFSSSLDRNLNERGYGSFLVDSPTTDERYTPNPSAPGWDYRVVYEVWVSARAFGTSGFGSAGLAFVHASPSKVGTDSVFVERRACPKSWAL